MNDEKFLNISDLSKKLDLVDPVSKKPLNHILRYWEKEFKQIKPKILNNRRYYSSEMIEIIRLIKFLLKDKGMTISGVKKQLNEDFFDIDANENKTINSTNLKYKLNRINKLIKDLKTSDGKKNTR